MGAKINLVLLVLLINSVYLFSQNHYLLESDHIPLIGFANAAWSSVVVDDNFDYIKFKEMGLEGIVVDFAGVPNDNQAIYNKFQNINDQVKLIPNMPWGGINFISLYTDAIYTKWQAKDVSSSNIKATLEYNHSIADRESGTNIIVTDTSATTPARLISGPGYRQKIRYGIGGDTTRIDYRATFRVKLTQNPNHPNPPSTTTGIMDDACTLKVMFKEIGHIGGLTTFIDSTTWPPEVLKVSDFDDWDIWNEVDIDYHLVWLENQLLSSPDKPVTSEPPPAYARYVEFIVEWNGLEYARLHFDNVIVSDVRGRNLTDPNSNTVRDQITNMSNNIFNNQPIFDESSVNFENSSRMVRAG